MTTEKKILNPRKKNSCANVWKPSILLVDTKNIENGFSESKIDLKVHSDKKLAAENEGNSSALIGILNIVNCIFGVGILGLPIVACKLGLIATLVLQPVLAITTAWTAKLIINAKIRTNSQTYEEICEKLLGQIGFWMLNISLWSMLICIMGMYICFSVKFVYPLIKGLGFTTWTKGKTFYTIGIGFISFTIIPLLLLKDLSRLGLSRLWGCLL
jgi:amino acid permease